jgi:DmsE family decaheme c-type cytochrome
MALAAMPATAQEAKESGGKPAAPSFAGSEICQGCHEDIVTGFRKNAHHALETNSKRGTAGHACEACHGPGSVHAESASAADIRNPAKLSAAEADRACLTCHRNQATHAGRVTSSHARNQVACTACHSMHKAAPEGKTVSKTERINQQCALCHQDVWASFQKPFKHKVAEGAMSCTDCHNPHGSVLPHALQTARGNEPGCLKCHTDKAGPFPYEHAVMRTDGCTACHQPHGSTNPRLLARPQVRFLCLECHSNLPLATAASSGGLGTVGPAIHDLRSARFQNCTLCHQKVHGSYVSKELLR